MINNYLESIKKQFLYIKSLGEKSFDQLDDEQLLWQSNESSNSIAIIVNHLYGNMLSRWTDFLLSDGEKEWRNRDQEFEDIIKTRNELLDKWEKGWTVLFSALDSINKDNFHQEIYIRNQGHTITEAINRQLGHYSYHVGQIVFIAKMLSSNDWESLSIPKGQSVQYNQAKFSEQKSTKHFSDEFIKK